MPVATQRGGAELTLLHALRHAGPGVRYLVVFLEEGPLVRIAGDLGADTAVITAGRVRDLRRVGATVRRLRRLLQQWKPDVVVSWMPKAHVYLALAGRGLSYPTLWFQHGLPSPSDPLDRLIALLPADGIFAPSEMVATAQRAVRPSRKTYVAYPGVELDDLPRLDPRRPRLASLNIPVDAPVVGLVARLQRWKGVHVLVEAFPRVLSTFPDAHAVIVGGQHPLEPDYADQLADRVQTLGLSNRVHLVGYQPDALAWMAEFDAVVHASDNEPFGIVVIEAMALGKPLIAGARGGPAEILQHGEEGFLVSYGAVDELADRVLDYLADPELAARMGGAAAIAAERFSAAVFGQRIASVLTAHAQDQLHA